MTQSGHGLATFPLLSKINELGLLLHHRWLVKEKFSSRVTDPQIDQLYEVARGSGVLGGGGYFLFLCRFNKWHKVAQEVEKCGGKVVNLAFDFYGLQTWEVSG